MKSKKRGGGRGEKGGERKRGIDIEKRYCDCFTGN